VQYRDLGIIRDLPVRRPAGGTGTQQFEALAKAGEGLRDGRHVGRARPVEFPGLELGDVQIVTVGHLVRRLALDQQHPAPPGQLLLQQTAAAGMPVQAVPDPGLRAEQGVLGQQPIGDQVLDLAIAHAGGEHLGQLREQAQQLGVGGQQGIVAVECHGRQGVVLNAGHQGVGTGDQGGRRATAGQSRALHAALRAQGQDQLLDLHCLEGLLQEEQPVGRRNPRADIQGVHLAGTGQHDDVNAGIPGPDLLGRLEPVEPGGKLHIDEGKGEAMLVLQGAAHGLHRLAALPAGHQVDLRKVVVAHRGTEELVLQAGARAGWPRPTRGNKEMPQVLEDPGVAADREHPDQPLVGHLSSRNLAPVVRPESGPSYRLKVNLQPTIQRYALAARPPLAKACTRWSPILG
jgi:hypothetical protein